MAHRHDDQGSPIALLLPLIFIVGSLTAIIISYHGELTSATFFPVAITIALFIYILTFIDPRIGICGLIIATGLSPEMVIGGVQNFRLEDFIVPAIFAAWITRLIEKKEEFEPTSLKAPIFLFLFFALVSTLYGLASETVSANTCLFIFGKTIEYYVIFLIILNNVKTLREAKAFTILIVLVSAATSIFSLSLYSQDAGQGRLMGPYGEGANVFGGYIIMLLALMTGLFLHADSLLMRALIAVIAIPTVFALMHTLSRTSYAAIFLAMVVVALLVERRLIVFTIAALLIFPMISPQSVNDRVSTIYTIGSQAPPESWSARTYAWQISIDKIVESPLFGKGMGYTALGYVDNEYVKVARDLGLCGLFAFLWILFRLGKDSFLHCFAVKSGGFLRGYAVGFFFAFVAIVIHATGATSFTTIRTMELFMILSGIFYAARNHSAEWEQEEVETKSDMIAAVDGEPDNESIKRPLVRQRM